MEAKKVSESRVESVELVQPSDLNVNNTLFGGALVSYVDEAAAICAYRHCQGNVATASIDQLNFLTPVPVKAILTLRASVNRVYKTSMEIGVKVTMRLHTEPGDHHVCSAYLTFVGVDEKGKPTELPQVIPETEEEMRRFENALKRRQLRFQLQEQLKK